mgnify:CR=1 FL=1
MLDGVNGNGPVEGKRYTMQSLNIQSGTRAASIFNEIDMSDGVEDNSLTEEQVLEYSKAVLSEKTPVDGKTKTNKDEKSVLPQHTYSEIVKAFYPELVNKHGLMKAMRIFKNVTGIDPKAHSIDPNLRTPKEIDAIKSDEERAEALELPEEIDGIKRNEEGEKELEKYPSNDDKLKMPRTVNKDFWKKYGL